MKSSTGNKVLVLCAALLLAVTALPSSAIMNAPNANIPGGGYVSPADIHAWIAAGGQITAEMQAYHGLFGPPIIVDGGILDGVIERYDSTLVFTITGTGPLKGWSRTLVVPAKCETHIAPRKADDPVQSFETNMYRIEGGITGDRDFESFQVVAGTGNGLESPGHTSIYRQKDGSWLIDSNFQIQYQIKYRGARGGKLDGVEDISEGTITMTIGPADPRMEEIARAARTTTAAAK